MQVIPDATATQVTRRSEKSSRRNQRHKKAAHTRTHTHLQALGQSQALSQLDGEVLWSRSTGKATPAHTVGTRDEGNQKGVVMTKW